MIKALNKEVNIMVINNKPSVKIILDREKKKYLLSDQSQGKNAHLQHYHST